MKNIVIRKMLTADVDEVYAIGRRASELLASDEDTFWDTDILRAWVEAGADSMLIAEADGRVVGFLLSQLHLPTRSGYLSDIAVHEEHRRQGIARMLMVEVLTEMKRRNIIYVYGLTKVTNSGIHKLLEEFGLYRGDAFYWYAKWF
jgi:ribosomal protein S18 acetylase RimI-like enzyme